MFARELIRPQHHHLLPIYMQTIPVNQDLGYDSSILSEAGMAELERVHQRLAEGDIRGTFTECKIKRSNSGGWTAESAEDVLKSGLSACFNSWNNLIADGKLEGHSYRTDQITTTSTIVWIGPDWFCTLSGSIYKFPPGPDTSFRILLSDLPC